ncbi:hypothetical protein [Streptomyces sp. KL118A]|uniref:hypothetical protein n=1 Tax=Streptomyces sp. KL118A TaxID=3045153 RepID=UPI00278BEB3C|nr:hypothetical protein [Streptomyces sp. KL118A]
MLRVLVVGFGDIARRGIRSILRNPGILLMECGTDAVTAVVAGTRPDVVVLEAGPRGGGARAARLAAETPGTTVVLCSAHRTDMRVYPASGGCYTRPLSARALIDGVRG